MILKPLGVAAMGAGSPPCVGIVGWILGAGLESEPRAVPDSATVMRRGLLSGNLALVGSDGNTDRESLAENDLAVLTPER